MIELEFKLEELVIFGLLEMSRQRFRESSVKWQISLI